MHLELPCGACGRRGVSRRRRLCAPSRCAASLVELHLGGNGLVALPRALAHLTLLACLDVSGSVLPVVHASDLPAPTYLGVRARGGSSGGQHPPDEPQSAATEEVWEGLCALRHLDLSSSTIYSAAGVAAVGSRLVSLSLRNNMLASLPPELCEACTALTSLLLSHNGLKRCVGAGAAVCAGAGAALVRRCAGAPVRRWCARAAIRSGSCGTSGPYT